MAGILNAVFGQGKSAIYKAVSSDADFADFATAASPSAPVHAASSVFTDAAQTAAAKTPLSFFGGPSYSTAGRKYTKWYRIWERTTIQDFYVEAFVIPILLVVVLIHVLGSRANRDRAKKWAGTYLPILNSEFSQVGYSDTSSEDDKATTVPNTLFREHGKNVFTTYATGRQNIAFVDIKLTLYKRYNPLAWLAELILSFLFDSFVTPSERVEVSAYTFDGKEKQLLPSPGSLGRDSSYDGFVWAVVHKDKMRHLREERYDLSLTSTKDHPKLPDWATVMSESAEITDVLLTPELIQAISNAGQDFEALIVSDQPIDAPKKLDDIVPKKRVGLSMRLNPNPSSTALFELFLRLPDQLVNHGHFRAEAMRRVKATRDDEQRKLRKIAEEERTEERRTQSDKLKKEERDRKLGRMSAGEQKKFLEKEREAESRKGMKKRSMRA